jgi:hypothetical protein
MLQSKIKRYEVINFIDVEVDVKYIIVYKFHDRVFISFNLNSSIKNIEINVICIFLISFKFIRHGAAPIYSSTNFSLYVSEDEKITNIRILLNVFANNQLLIWCTTASEVSKLEKLLTNNGENAVKLTEQNHPENLINLVQFRCGHARILISKYNRVVKKKLIIDVPVPVIINYELPISPVDYGDR